WSSSFHLLSGACAEDRGRVPVEDAAVPADEDEVVLVDLPLAALSARLDHSFGERREAPHVVGRELSAARVRRQRPVRRELAVLDEGAALSLRAEAVVLER